MEASDVRSVRHEATRRALVDAAIELFAEHGYASVTVEQIAAAAGVSRRTAYRRFRTKDDILLELPRRWLDVWDRFITDAGDLSARQLVEGASLSISAHIDDHRRETLVGLAVLDEAPGLASTSVAGDDWHERVVGLLVADDEDPVDAALIAGAYLGGIDAMLAIWAQEPSRSLVELNEQLNERLRPIWSA